MSNKYYFYGKISRSKSLLLQETISEGLQIAQEKLGILGEIKVKIYILPRMKYGYESRGYVTKKYINVIITEKYLNSKNLKIKLSSTIIHEYVHLSRLSLGLYCSSTVLSSMVEEGIAIYAQTILSEAPRYLDIKNLNEKIVTDYWKIFDKVLDQPSKKYPQIEGNNTYRVMYYRIGFSIVLRYMELHPKINLTKLTKISEEKLIKFAKSIHTKFEA